MTRRIRRFILLACLTTGFAGGCQQFTSTGEVPAPQTGTPTAPVDLGPPMYARATMPALPAGGEVKDTIVVPNAVVRYAEKQLVPAAVDGQIELVAVQLPPGAAYDKNDKRITTHPRDTDKTRVFRSIYPGTVVNKGDVVAWLDASQIEAQYKNSKRLIDSTNDSIRLAGEGVAQVDKLVKQLQSTINVAASASEVIQMLIQKTRFEENLASTKQTQIKAYQDYESAESLLRKHQPTAAVTGRVTNVFKRPGEFAKAGEPILEIQATDEVLIEGELPIQYLSQVRAGQQVRVESTRPTAENRQYGTVSHRREVTGIAVTAHASRPMVVTGGMDGVALVWEPFAKKAPHTLPHPVAVRSVAVTGSKSTAVLAATGCEDGKVRVWNLTNADKLPGKDSDAKTMDENHVGPVTCLAFSPDGKYLASSSGRDVMLWDVSTGKKLYTLPGEHKDTVTALRFTPQATLVTACRDKAVRVWNLGMNAASVDKVLDHRAGVVDHLAVSADGSRVLFDQEDNRIDLVSLGDGQTAGTIQTVGQSRFSTFAVFSAEDNFVVTASGSSSPGEMQLWETPSRGRAAERVRLVTPGRTPVTCAAFSTDPTKKFLVVGTANGGVFLYTPPSEKDALKIVGTVESVLNYNDKSAMVRVRVMNPPADVLQDRGTANIIIDPSAVAMITPPTSTVPVASPPPSVPMGVTTPATAVIPTPATGLGSAPSTVSPGAIIPIPTVPNEKKN